MRTTRKIARSIFHTIKAGAFVGVEIAAGSLHFVADMLEEGIDAFDAFADYADKKIEELDQE